jgi:hypothetical protein
MDGWSIEPEIDAPHDHAIRFLARLDHMDNCAAPNDQVTFQTFDDSHQGRRELIRIRHGNLAQHWRELKALNEQGAGIFCTVNRTNAKGRRIANIVAVRALLLDLDGAPLYPVLAAKLRPHLVTETSHQRYHCLWLTSDCSLGDYATWQEALARRFGGDPTVIDLARCTRLPGHWNRKRGKPESCRVLVEHFAPAYSIAGIAAGLGLERRRLESPRPAPARAPTSYTVTPYCRRALEDAYTAITQAPDGTQNTVLNRESFALGTLVENFAMPPTAAIEVLVAAGLKMPDYDRRRPWSEHEIRRTIERSFGEGVLNPRPRSRIAG